MNQGRFQQTRASRREPLRSSEGDGEAERIEEEYFEAQAGTGGAG